MPETGTEASARLNEALMLLSQGLDLCVRARKLDELLARAVVAGGIGEERPMAGSGTRCFTPALWVQDAYDQDLEAWEARSKEALSRLAPFSDHLPPPSGITALLQMAHEQASDHTVGDGSTHIPPQPKDPNHG